MEAICPWSAFLLAGSVAASLPAARVHGWRREGACRSGREVPECDAVEENDARTMDQVLADDFILAEGNEKRSSGADLLKDATSGKTYCKIQRDTDRTIMVSGGTAVVTAKLWAKGIEDGVVVDYKLLFGDVNVRTPKGRYFFGHALLPQPTDSRK
jgi:hypothetical protein